MRVGLIGEHPDGFDQLLLEPKRLADDFRARVGTLRPRNLTGRGLGAENEWRVDEVLTHDRVADTQLPRKLAECRRGARGGRLEVLVALPVEEYCGLVAARIHHGATPKLFDDVPVSFVFGEIQEPAKRIEAHILRP